MKIKLKKKKPNNKTKKQRKPRKGKAASRNVPLFQQSKIKCQKIEKGTLFFKLYKNSNKKRTLKRTFSFSILFSVFLSQTQQKKGGQEASPVVYIRKETSIF
jgi:hypothetical protein